MLFRFGVPCLFRFTASLSPGSGRRRYAVQPGGSLDRMEPEGVAEKLGAISWTGVGIFSRIFKSIRQTFSVANVGCGWRQRGVAVVGFAIHKIIKIVMRNKTRRNGAF